MVVEIRREDPDNWRGEINDVFNLFWQRQPTANGASSRPRTLILHDPADTFVPFVHTESAAQRTEMARLRAFHLPGRILWLGPDASGMHQVRVDFPRGP